MSDSDLSRLSAEELVSGYRLRRFSPLEVTNAVLARIRAVNPRLNAYVTVAEEQAVDAARRATAALDEDGDLPLLHGVPVSIKDVTPTRGIRTTWGSRIFEDHVPAEDALAVARLKEAGAIVIGKTNTPEFAAGAHTFNDLFGVTRNPWNPSLSAGGSSGGAACAVAAAMGPLAEGSDLGGSLRTPAAFCGVVGFRPSPGLVPNHPTRLCWSPLPIRGPIARTVRDTARMLAAMAGPDGREPLSWEVDTMSFLRAAESPSIRGWRIAWTPDLDGLVPVEPAIVDIAGRQREVFTSLGAEVTDACPDFSGMYEIIRGTRGLSMVALHADKLPRWRNMMQEGLVWNIDQGLALTVSEIARAEVLRSDLWQRVNVFMRDYDLLLLPGTAALPFPVEYPWPPVVAGVPQENYMDWFSLTYAISLTGLPVICVPCGFTDDGLPVGLQIVGRRRRDADVLRAAAAFEAATGFPRNWPPFDPDAVAAPASGRS